MRVLIISDIHANLSALDSVLADAKDRWDVLWCLGDLVGYGPKPNECVELVRTLDPVCLLGNHDWAALGRIDIEMFNNEAREVVEWTQEQLEKETIDYLETLESKTVVDDYTLAHASPRYPIWEYVLDLKVAAANFDVLETPYCFIGQSHVPLLFEKADNSGVEWYLPSYAPTSINGTRMIINPGSVGQPRDNDPRASYVILDTDEMTIEHRRVPYPIEVTQGQMREAGLPNRQIERLAQGW